MTRWWQIGIALALVGSSRADEALAQAAPPAAPPASEAESAPKVVRIALSKEAADKLSELRVRRLVELQLGGDVEVALEPVGPLDEHAVRVFIDMSEPTVVLVQAQVLGKRLETRSVDVSGLPWEVATRFVAIATSESVREQLVPRRKPRPRLPTPDEIAERLASEPSFEVGARLEGAYAGAIETGVFGSRLSLSFHQLALSEKLSLAMLGTFEGDFWLEADVTALHRIWFGPDFRLNVGAGFALAATDAGLADSSDIDLWVRAHAAADIDIRILPSAFVVIGLDPGIVIDPAHEQVGPWVGGSVGISFEGR